MSADASARRLAHAKHHPGCVARHVGKPASHRGRSRGGAPSPGIRFTRGCAKPEGRGGGHARASKPTNPRALTNAGAAPAGAPAGPPRLPTIAGPSQPATPPGSPGESSPLGEANTLPWPLGGVENDPIDPKYLTEAPFGTKSFWIQPWRAYMDTWPASRLLDSLGINFNVGPAEAESTAQLLQDSGFKLARREIDWSSLSYEDPTKFVNESRIRTVLDALHNHGLRPLILLNANSGAPGPSRKITLETTSAAPQGAQSVTLTASSAAAVIPGKTGFNGLSFGGAPDILITSVAANDVATLSRPLLSPLAAGAHKGATLLYAPFAPPKLPNGEANPLFQETLAGWLSYVGAVAKEAAAIFGPQGYDLEVWNELGFGSQFLDSSKYYSPGSSALETSPASGGSSTPEGSSSPESGLASQSSTTSESPASSEAVPDPESVKAVAKEIIKTLLDETVAYVRNPANGISSGVGITDGFASQTPFPSGALAPLGLTALSKHLYAGPRTFPDDYMEQPIRPLNALGARDTASGSSFAPLFIPSYQSLLPEYSLTATSTETVVRDLAPTTTNIYGFPHGRNVGPPGGSPLEKWMTEYNLGTQGATIMGPDGVTPQGSAQLTAADKEHFEAKAMLRSLVSMVNKGMTREYFFAAAPGALSLVGQSFFSALKADPSAYPGDQLGGETMSGFRDMLAQFQGPGPSGAARQLQLLSIAQDGNHAQFAGDGTAAHPSLFDRDVLAVLPFQASPTRFEIPVYVMTRDMLTLYDPNAPTTEVSRFDLPDETFRITLANLPETTDPPTVSAYDPLRNRSTPAQLVSRDHATATFELTATDYPRILTIDYTGR
jgi:hypothetical protein